MKFNNNYHTDNIYISSISFSKLTILNLLNFLLFIPLIILIALTVNSINNYGILVNNLPYNINAIRAWFLFILILYFFINSFIISNAIKYIRITNYKILAILSCVLPIMFIFDIVKGINEQYFLLFWYYLRNNREEGLQIDHFAFWNWITKKRKCSKIIKNTILFYITLIAFTISLGFIFSDYNNHYNSDDYFIFYSLSFFTQQNNFLCWVFLLLFCFFNKKILFSNNTYLLYSASYILIVGIVANIMIFPYISIDNNIDEFYCAYPIVKFIWFHVIDPILFVWFAINTLSVNYQQPIAYKCYLINFMRYPFFYAIYLYSVPFLCQYSIYGQLTNLNSNMIIEKSNSYGDPLWSLAIIGAAIFFILIGSLMRYINIKIIKNYDTFKIY